MRCMHCRSKVTCYKFQPTSALHATDSYRLSVIYPKEVVIWHYHAVFSRCMQTEVNETSIAVKTGRSNGLLKTSYIVAIFTCQEPSFLLRTDG